MNEPGVTQFMHASYLSKDGQGIAEVGATVGLIYKWGVSSLLSF